MWLGKERDNKTKPLGISWPDRPLRVLGVYFSYDQKTCVKLNFSDRIDEAQRIVNWWKTRNLTMYGRIQIIKTFVMSQFMYVSSVIHTPPEVIRRINKLVFKFIWRNKSERLKRRVLMSNIVNGGLKAPDFQSMIGAARLKWIKKISTSAEAPWKLILEKYLERLNIPLHVLLISNYDMKSSSLDKADIPQFYKEMLKLWCEMGNTLPAYNKGNFLWFNKDICVKGKSLFYEQLFRAGVWYISDLYGADGSAIPFETWVSRGVGRHNLIKWMGLIKKTKQMKGQCDEPNEEGPKLSFLAKGPMNAVNTKVIYIELLAKTFPQTTEVYVPRISKYLNNYVINWSEVYLRASKTTMDTKTREFQYKFIHDLLSNSYWLHKWKKKDTATCQFCNMSETENIVHMFWSCHKTEEFWGKMNAFCRNHQLLQNDIIMRDVFIGVEDTILCTLIFAAKTFIYNKRIHDEQFTFGTFLIYLSKFKMIEFYIAKNNDTVGNWMEKWKFLPD